VSHTTGLAHPMSSNRSWIPWGRVATPLVSPLDAIERRWMNARFNNQYQNVSIWDFVGTKDDYWSYKCARLWSNCHQQQAFYRPDAFPVTQPTASKHQREKVLHAMDLLTPSSPGVCQLCLWPLIAPGYLGGGLSRLLSASRTNNGEWVSEWIGCNVSINTL